MISEADTEAWRHSLTTLEAAGVNWVAFIHAEGDGGPAAPPGCDGDGRGLLVFVARGGAFAAQTAFEGQRDAFDDRSRRLALDVLERHLRRHDADATLVYPGETPLSLVAWMNAGRVQAPSRLGIGIRPDVGPWFAVRAAIWVALPRALENALRRRYPPIDGVSPCEGCAAPCVEACPAEALSQPLQLQRCIDHRLAPSSSCQARCLAREACPVGVAFRYDDQVIGYHAGVSLEAIRRWQSGAPGE